MLLLCGLQASFYLLPIPAPALWFIVFCHYSYNKPLLTATLLNLLLAVILLNFSVGNAGILLGSLNFATLILKVIKSRFHVGASQTVVTIGIGSFLFFFSLWAANQFLIGIYYPHVFQWLGTSLTTLLATPFILFPLYYIEKMFFSDYADTLEDLRV